MNYIQKIHLLISHRRFPEAERETRLALTDEPLEPILHMFLAVCLLQDDKRLEEATQEAQQAVGLDPEDPAYHYVLASTLLKRHRRAEARRSFEDALRLNPASSQYWSGLADLELQEARWQAALDAANQGLQDSPAR